MSFGNSSLNLIMLIDKPQMVMDEPRKLTDEPQNLIDKVQNMKFVANSKVSFLKLVFSEISIHQYFACFRGLI
jgi:hypothetical protein